ncbi:MAG: response regulator [bacterium]
MATILTVDDDEKIRALLEVVLTRRGHHVLTASSALEAMEVFRRERPLVTILDLQLPDMNGLSVLQQIRALDPAVCVIILTGANTAQLGHDARELGATEVLQKGFSLHTIGDTVSGLLTQAKLMSNPPSPSESNKDAISHTERRKHPRMPVQLHVALFKDGVVVGDGEIVDLSIEGCALRTLVTVEQKDYLVVHITDPLTRSNHEASVPFICELAAVRWVHQPKCGLEFIIMTPENKDRLHRYVKALQDRVPSTAATS